MRRVMVTVVVAVTPALAHADEPALAASSDLRPETGVRIRSGAAWFDDVYRPDADGSLRIPLALVEVVRGSVAAGSGFELGIAAARVAVVDTGRDGDALTATGDWVRPSVDASWTRAITPRARVAASGMVSPNGRHGEPDPYRVPDPAVVAAAGFAHDLAVATSDAHATHGHVDARWVSDRIVLQAGAGASWWFGGRAMESRTVVRGRAGVAVPVGATWSASGEIQVETGELARGTLATLGVVGATWSRERWRVGGHAVVQRGRQVAAGEASGAVVVDVAYRY
jgi:hypothetical protein